MPQEEFDTLMDKDADLNELQEEVHISTKNEEKAIEIFDILETISEEVVAKEESLEIVNEVIKGNIELYKTLIEKFPEVVVFKEQLEKNENAKVELDTVVEVLRSTSDSAMSIMDIMQYQDIHRKKIERVINVMHSLSRYMGTLFEGETENSKEVSSEQYIADHRDSDLVSTDEIEAFLEEFGESDKDE